MTRSSKTSCCPSPVGFYRDSANGRLMGVCAGIADHFGFSVKGVRIATVISGILFTGPTVLVYLVLGFVLKDKPREIFETPQEDAFWRDVRTDPAGTSRDLRHRFRELERRLRTAEAHVTSREYRLRREIDDL